MASMKSCFRPSHDAKLHMLAETLWLMKRMIKTHWNRHDFRIGSLRITIQGLDNSVQQLRKKLVEIEYYDGLWLLEESEPIYGLAFIALQNYINSSIYDKFDSLNKQYEKYKKGNILKNTGRTGIELIIGVANYFKHRDDHKDLRSGTTNILADFNLEFDNEIDIVDSPIFKGLDILTESHNLNELIDIVRIWREKLWEED